MKIFISYGHNDHVKLVDKVFDTLIQAGHEPWKDDRYEGRSGIAAGEEFTKVIYDAIDASDFVIAFVSQVTKERPYCIGERNYAYNRKGNHFIQVRLDHTDIRLGNEQSYIDMSDVEETTGEINERMFDEQVNKLFSAFRDPVSFAEGGFTPWAKFEKHLKVPGTLQYDEFVTMPDVDDFVGRKWLTEKCRKWATDDSNPCRLFVIYGEAGTGKTAFVRHLAQDRELVRSVHVCIYDRPRTRTVEDTIKDLAYVLAKNNDTYFNFLKNKDFSTLDELGVDGLFEFLFLEPLKTESAKFLLIIDGLDELDEKKGFDPLIKLFRQHATRINPNISFLVTGRPDNNIISRMQTVGAGNKVESVNLDIDTNHGDLKEYIDKKLHEKGIYTQALSEKILDACDGNFEYLALLFREADEGLILSEQMVLPEGLYSRYTQYIERRFENNGLMLRFSKLQRRLMSVLCAVYEPLSLSLLADILGEDEYDIEDELHIFGSLIRQKQSADTNITVSLFTKGFRDYLLSKVCREFQSDYKKGNAEIAEYIINNFADESDYLKVPYVNSNGLAHILVFADEDFDVATEYIDKLYKNNTSATAQRLANALVKCESKAVQSFAKMIKNFRGIYYATYAQLRRNREKNTLTHLKTQFEELGYLKVAESIKYDLLAFDPSPEAYKEMENICRQRLKVYEQDFKANPCYNSRRQLAYTYTNLGDIFSELNSVRDIFEAEEWYKKAVELKELNYADNPCYDSRLELSVTYERLGDISGSITETEKWYRKTVELCELNFNDNPCYKSRRNLYISYTRLGNIIYRSKTTPEIESEAEKLNQKALNLCEQNYRDNPCYESRRDLAFMYDRLGRFEDNYNKDYKKAQEWYRKKLELDEQNYRDTPCYESRTDLLSDYRRLYNTAKAKNTPEGFADAQKWLQKEFELIEQNYKDNPCDKSRTALTDICKQFIDEAIANPTSYSMHEVENWCLKKSEIDRQAFNINPCVQTKNNLISNYRQLIDFSKNKNTVTKCAQEEKWKLKILEIEEQFYQNKPCEESRKSLIRMYKLLIATTAYRNAPEYASITEKCYHKIIEICKAVYESAPGAKRKRELVRAYEGLAGFIENNARVMENPDRLTEVEDLYKNCLEIHKKYIENNPCDEDTVINIVRTYKRLAGNAKAKNTPEGIAEAEKWYLESLELYEQSLCNNSTKQSISNLIDIYRYLAGIARDKKTSEGLAEAEKWYFKILDFCKQAYGDQPDFHGKNHLADTYLQIGCITMLKSAPDRLKQAEYWLQKSLELSEQNYAEKFEDTSVRILSLTYCTLGNIAKVKNTSETVVEAKEWYLKAYELAVQNYRKYADNHNEALLHTICETLYKISKDKNNSEGDEEAEDWIQKFETEKNNARNRYKQNPKFGLFSEYIWKGDTANRKRTSEGFAEAEEWYLKALEICEQDYKDNPCDISRGNLFRTYNKLADNAEHSKSSEEDALIWYKKALDFCEQDYKDYPCDESREHLFRTYNKLADNAEHSKSSEEDALIWYKKALDFCEQDYKDYPCDKSRENLVEAYCKLAFNAKYIKSSEEDALVWYKKALDFCEQDYKDYPCETSRRNLLVAYNKLADNAKYNKSSKEEVLIWYKKALDFCETHYKTEPYDTTCRHDLIRSYENLARFYQQEGSLEELAEAEKLYLKVLPLVEEDFKNAPHLRTANSVIDTYEKLADVNYSKKSPEGIIEAEKWAKKHLELGMYAYKNYPGFISNKHLETAYQKFYEIALEKNDNQDNAEAENWYRQKLEFLESEAKNDPCVKNIQSFANSCEERGDFLKEKNTPEGLAEAEKWYLKAIKLYEQIYTENPYTVHKRTVVRCYEKLKEIAKTNSTPVGDSESDKWLRLLSKLRADKNE